MPLPQNSAAPPITLDRMIGLHDGCRNQLIAAIQADSDYETIKLLDQRLSMLVTRIRDIHLIDKTEINRQIKFFMTRSGTDFEKQVAGADYDTVNLLLDRYLLKGAGFDNSVDRIIGKFLSAISNDNKKPLSEEAIKQSTARISVYDSDLRHKYTSIGNSKFHNMEQSAFVGMHLANLIGDQRFEQRARPYAECCFKGHRQTYCYFLDVPNQGERLMECQFSPHYDKDGAIHGVLLTVEDITESLFQGPSARQNS